LIAFVPALLWVPAIAHAQQAQPVVAVYQMEDLANSGTAQTFTTMIETAVASSGRFRVMERSRLNVAEREQTMARSGRVTTNQPGRRGGFEGVDFLIYGTITSVAVSQKNDIGATLLSNMLSRENNSCSKRRATVSIDIRITDADTGEIRNATRITESQDAATVCNGQSQIDSALLLRGAAEKISGALVTSIYPIQVAAVQPDGTIILNYGEGTLKVGSLMTIYSRGESIRDPSTGQVIGSNESRLGTVKITEVSPRMSRAQMTTPFTAPVGSVVRAASEDDIQAARRQNNRRKR
jgi:curli biogenesis system outer membrane secretion channel CsgG